jgi:hypothetical protein
MRWRLASALDKLRAQVNDRFLSRSKDSDGSIGDAAHASRASDHNPWIMDGGLGVVSAIDITHDPKSGCDSYALAEALRTARDPRIKYVISNRRIFAGPDGPQPWVWRKYTGANPHDHHVHVSVRSEKRYYDAADPWAFDMGEAAKPDSYVPPPPMLRRGARGDDVRELQRLLNLGVDGIFGPNTEAAVRLVQAGHKLVIDGIVGPQTWAALKG